MMVPIGTEFYRITWMGKGTNEWYQFVEIYRSDQARKMNDHLDRLRTWEADPDSSIRDIMVERAIWVPVEESRTENEDGPASL